MTEEIEFILDESKFKINPQGIQLVDTIPNSISSDLIVGLSALSGKFITPQSSLL